jgi:hypothetical protein
MKIYKLEVTERMNNNTVEGVYGYYSTEKLAKEAQQKLFVDFGVDVLNEGNSRRFLDIREAITLEEVEINKEPLL